MIGDVPPAAAAPAGAWRKQEDGGLDHFTLRGGSGTADLHLYAPANAGAAVTRLLDAARADMPRLVAEVQRLRAEVEALIAVPPRLPATITATVFSTVRSSTGAVFTGTTSGTGCAASS